MPQPLPLLFATHLSRDRRRSAHTVRAYAATAERLIAFLQSHWGGAADAAALHRITAADLRAFLAHRREQGLGNAAAARELSAVRAFIAFTGGEAPPLRGPRVAKNVPRPISPDEAVALAEEVADSAADTLIADVLSDQDCLLCILEKLESTAELARAEVTDLDPSSRQRPHPQN